MVPILATSKVRKGKFAPTLPPVTGTFAPTPPPVSGTFAPPEPDNTILDLYKIQPSDCRAKASYIIGHPDLSQISSVERKWKVIQEHYNAMRAVNVSEQICSKIIFMIITQLYLHRNQIASSFTNL